MDATYVGIDVSKDRLDVHVQPTGEAFAVARDGEGLAALIERLKPLSPHLVAVEATGGFEMTVAAAIAGAALPLAVVNPAQVRHYAQALGRHAKTDRIDAEVIARFAAATRPEPRALPDEATQALAELVTRRRQIITMMVAERQRDRVENYIRVGQEEGAKVALGGGRPEGIDKGWFVEPTVFVDVENSMRIAQEEIFGPVLSVIPYDDDADAVRIANDSEYGLCGGVFTGDNDRGLAVARQVRTGTYMVNSSIPIDFSSPFGGYKASGVGREFGEDGLELFLEKKTINLPAGYSPTV